MAESKLLPTNYQLIYLTLPSPNIDLLVRSISLLKKAASIIVGILALSTCTNITYSGTYAVLKLVVNCCLENRDLLQD